MYSKDTQRNSSRDWLNLSNNKKSIEGIKLISSNIEKHSNGSITPQNDVSPRSYINVVTPVDDKKALSRGRRSSVISENFGRSKTSLSDLLDTQFPTKNLSREASKDHSFESFNSVEGFFGRFSMLGKYEILVRKLNLPKIHEHFRPQVWTFGIF